jgi:thiamine biosynthesis protein ThiS
VHTDGTISIVVNGQHRRVPAGMTIAQLANELGLVPEKVAVERNLEVVPRSTLASVCLEDGDDLEIVHFVGGGDHAAALRPGANIAIKVPLHRWEQTVAFYRDRVGLKVVRALDASIGFGFGAMTLWIDRVDHQSQVDVWLELFSDDPSAALERLGSPRRDELEPLDSVEGHWTSDPAGTVLLVRKEG